MSRTVYYMFILILVLIIVAYWEGAKNVASTFLGGVNSIIKTLQGRDNNGKFANYPQ